MGLPIFSCVISILKVEVSHRFIATIGSMRSTFLKGEEESFMRIAKRK